MIYLELFYRFFITGLFAVGGGLATLPFLYDMSEATGWFTAADISNMIAISESTPGPIGVNMGTYVGYTTTGVWGGLTATIGLITPSVIVIVIVAKMLERFKNAKVVNDVFFGLRPASTGLIAAAGIGIVKISFLNLELFNQTQSIADLFVLKAIILAVIVFIAIKKLDWHPIVYILFSAVIGVIFKF